MTRHEPRDGALREAREALDRSREWVAGQLDPPVTSKSIERWEAAGASVKRWRVEQLADLYGVPFASFYDSEVVAA